MLARSAGYNEEEISENGFLRKVDNDKLDYFSFSVSDKISDESVVLKTDVKNYYLKTENAGLNIILDNEIKNYLKSLENKNNCNMPTDKNEFEIFRKECIERGLREL